MSRIVRFIAYIAYIFYPKRVFDCFDGIWRKFYTLFMRNRFHSAGTDCCFQKFNSLHNPKNIALGTGVRIGKMAVLSAWKEGTDEVLINIGPGVDLGDFIHISAANKVVIGFGTLVGRFVTITDNAHGSMSIDDLRVMPLSRPVVSKGPVIIGEKVWIGDKVTILGGVTIGDGAVIGANSVVTNNIPAGCVACGCPAVCKKRVVEFDK